MLQENSLVFCVRKVIVSFIDQCVMILYFRKFQLVNKTNDNILWAPNIIFKQQV